MHIVKLGKRGRVTIPRSVIRRLGLEPGALFLLDVTDVGEMVLRPASAHPIEIYSDERVEAFLEEDRLSGADRSKLSSRENE